MDRLNHHRQAAILDKTVLHLSFDFPDNSNKYKPKVIMELIHLEKGHKHLVISLNKTENLKEAGIFFEENCIRIDIFYFRFGFLLNHFLKRASKKIIYIIKENNIKFDIIHAHKLTFEGIIAKELADYFKSPFVVTFRGNTDFKVLNYKIFSKKTYRGVINEASKIIFLAPWTLEEAAKRLHVRFKKKAYILPNITGLNKRAPGKICLADSDLFFVSIFNFENLKCKNLDRTLKAFDKISYKYRGIKFYIIGDGSKKGKVKKIVKKYNSKNNIKLLGHKSPGEFYKLLQKSLGLVLPSYPETFGVVYLEALSANTPIIYARNAGVDGYFPYSFAKRVSHKSAADITNAMQELIENEKELKEELYDFIQNNGLKDFFNNTIVQEYGNILKSV